MDKMPDDRKIIVPVNIIKASNKVFQKNRVLRLTNMNENKIRKTDKKISSGLKKYDKQIRISIKIADNTRWSFLKYYSKYRLATGSEIPEIS